MDLPPRSSGRQPPPPAGKQTLPRLIRCKSEHQNTHPPSSGISSNKSTTVTKSRSISTTKTRNYKELEVNNITTHLRNPMTINTSLTSPATKKKAAQDGTFVRILPRKKPTSPSAWALSPGRVAPCPSASPTVSLAKSPSPSGRTTSERRRSSGGGITGVLNYFRQKKAASTEDTDRLYFKLMNNRLLQWRFANARAETTISTVNTVAEKKLFNAWLEILAIRNSNMVKRMEVRKLENDIKLYHVMNSQLFLLEKWSTMEAKNFEAVSRVVRKMSVASVNIPLLHDSKGDVLAVSDVLDTATRLLEDIESTITKSYYQAEKSCYLLTELSIIAKLEKESLVELQTWMTDVASLKETERSLQTHLIQIK